MATKLNQEYEIGQAYSVYTGKDVTYTPFQERMAKIFRDIFGPRLTEEQFFAHGVKYWDSFFV